MTDVDDFLAHHGVKGMKWGVKRDRPDGVSRKTNRDASKDAKEFARAKAFYGEGAGTRRKLIKTSVEAKSAKDSSYQKAFDHHLAKQDMDKHVSKAKSERKRKDVVGGTAKTARGVHRSLTGGFGSVTLASAGIAAGVVYARKTGVDKVLANAANKKLNEVLNTPRKNNGVEDWAKKNGFL